MARVVSVEIIDAGAPPLSEAALALIEARIEHVAAQIRDQADRAYWGYEVIWYDETLVGGIGEGAL